MPTARARRLRRQRALRVVPLVVLALLLAAVAAGAVWTQLVYTAEPEKVAEVYRDPTLRLTETSTAWIMAPAGRSRAIGLLFMPGAKVEPKAYLWTLSGLPAQGVTVVVAKPRLNLAIVDSRAVATFVDSTRGANRWYVSGHSMGGVRACALARDPRTVGLVLMASYCNESASRKIPTLSIFGERDGVLNQARADQYRTNLPAGAAFSTLAGANHASFGAYGPQSGDKPATKPPTEVRAELTAVLVGFLR